MIKTRSEKLVFGVLMSVTMAIGMEVYNVAIKMGYNTMPGGLSNMVNQVFPDALVEASYMWIFVFLFSNLWGNRLGHALAAKLIRPEQDNPFFITLMISSCTVLVMCPTMSMVAAILFNVILAGNPVSQLPAIWVGTLIKNFPMALLWNLFAAGPFSRLVYRKIFRH
ncbi:MAG: DUF2798 domain-containing protein [Candidatus Limivicinus sp.]|nr:DUF2798 domain-containing protein [Clostridiales bacterium]MDY6133613.1 DUF2798 domain-containing protein [Candidatus Limivicinus sp.]